MALIGTAVLELLADTARFKAELVGAAGALQTFGKQATKIGTAMSLKVTAPILLVGGAVTKTTSSFEESMSRITGLVGVAADQVSQWSKDLLALGPAVGRTPQELAEGMFFVTSAGLRGAAALDVLTQSARGAAGGLGETKVIADAVTSAVNAYGAENLSATRAVDILTAAVREGKLEASSLAPVLGNLLPTSSKLGIGFDQVAGLLAVMSRTGQDAASGATSLLNVMNTLLKPTNQARRQLKGLGIDMGDLREVASSPNGLIKVMRLLDTAFEGNEEAIAAVFPNIRALRGVMNALAQDSKVVDSVLTGVSNSAGSLDRAFEAAQKTTKFKLNAALSSMQASMIEIGGTVAPAMAHALEGIASGIKAVARSFTSLTGTQQKMIVGLLGIAAAAGPAILLLGKLAQATFYLGIAFARLGGAAAFSAVTRAVAPLLTWLGPGGLIALGLTAIISLVLRWRFHVDDVAKAHERAKAKLDEYQQALASANKVAVQNQITLKQADLDAARAAVERYGKALEDATNAGKQFPAGEVLRLSTAQMEVSRLTDQVTALKKRLDDLNAPATPTHVDVGDVGGSASAIEAAKDALDEYETSMRTVAGLEALLGDKYDATTAKLQAYRQAIDALVGAGVDVTRAMTAEGDSVKDLTGKYKALFDLQKQEAALTTLRAEGAAVTASYYTEEQKRHAEIVKLIPLLLTQSITTETYNRELKRLSDTTAQQTALEKQRATLMDLLLTPQQKVIQQIQTMNLLFLNGMVTLQQYVLLLAVLQKQLTNTAAVGTATADVLSQALATTAFQGIDAFLDFSNKARRSFHAFVVAAASDLTRLLAKIALIKLAQHFLPGVGNVLAAAAGITGKATGGPVVRGRPYVVGEKGPELFVPAAAGKIVASGASADGGSYTLRLDTGSLPPAPRLLSPDAFATDDWWRRAISKAIIDREYRGG